MKPDCQQVLTQFASFSVEELSDSEAANLLQHIEDCEPCKGQWLLFEKTLMVVTQSGPHDEDVEQHRSQQMWLVCLEHARHNAQKSAFHENSMGAARASTAKNAMSEARPKANLDSHSSACDAKDAAVLVAPRVGMTLLGGALLLLASSYWLAPTPAPSTALPAMPAQLQTVGFKTLPRAAAPMVDYGATMGFDALADRVAPSLMAAPTKNIRATRSPQTP